MKHFFRGLNKNNEWVYGSLVETTDYIQHKPKQHTKTWIVTRSFGNGGWFNIQHKQYVKPETVGRYTGIDEPSLAVKIFEGDIVTVLVDGVGSPIPDGFTGVVTFLEGAWVVVNEEEERMFLLWQEVAGWVVLGSIYDRNVK